METERPSPRYSDLDVWEPSDIVEAMIEGQFTAVAAVRSARFALVQAALATETRLRDGGRLVYVGAGTSGRLAVQAGAHCLEKSAGGMGVLLGGVAGVAPARIAILGAGVVGTNAAQMAVGTGAQVVVLDRNLDALRRLDTLFGGRVMTVHSNADDLEREVLAADLVISGVLIPGAAAPKLITRAMMTSMKKGSVIVDVAIDQGGATEGARATTHAEPTYVLDGVVNYMVANMPGAVPRTSTYALNHATLPFVLALADKGWQRALREDPHLAAGLNVAAGAIAYAAVADSLGLPYTPAARLIR